ncbi:hypothetical protein ATI61_108122 [Archangium gephyra]|uniref:ABC transporter ATP-binding protein n=1 Tax=Archangium gephyra TaxID=48 RepID=A0AAC8Q7V0_9BACT|nr:hypothetical protein [Archangium gephyra]AKJ02489.1 ABC transporter ATP-binding protein [Archangium gephyra]REG28589.1 hypothetical protein ATI61_108122 [Archangium gephyra]
MELRIRGVSKTYPNGVRALKDVTLTIPAGMYGLLGPNGAVLLSTHIVEDVSELCTRMAIIDQGELLLEAEPLRAVAGLHGRIWRRIISKHELPAVEREHAVISTKLLAGRTVVRVFSDTAPGPGFEPVEPDLEDVYFSTMAGHLGRRREQPEPEAAP